MRVQLPGTRVTKFLWPSAKEVHEPEEVGSSPCPFAEPGAQPFSTASFMVWEGNTGDSNLLSGMALKVNLTFQPLLPAVCMCIRLHDFWKEIHIDSSNKEDIIFA